MMNSTFCLELLLEMHPHAKLQDSLVNGEVWQRLQLRNVLELIERYASQKVTWVQQRVSSQGE